MAPQTLSIMEALDNLNALIEAPSLEALEIINDSHFSLTSNEQSVPSFGVNADHHPETLEVIRETFRAVFHHVRHYYESQRLQKDPRQLVEGVNTIMVLAGEAALKLEEYQSQWGVRIEELLEYRQLRNFYQNKVLKETFSDFVKPLKSKKKKGKSPQGKSSLLDDLEIVKKDRHYELFYLKNESGHQFFTTNLERRIKLACDFGEYKEHYIGEDPLLQLKNWEDRSLHVFAKRLLHGAEKKIQAFYKHAFCYRDSSFIKLVHQSLMALMLCAEEKNQIRQFSKKACFLYFHDFQTFLRESLHHKDFQHALIHGVPQGALHLKATLECVIHLIEGFFLLGPENSEMNEMLASYCKEEARLSLFLLEAYKNLQESLAAHPSGPVFKAVDLLREKEIPSFDPLLQGNLPTREFKIHLAEKDILFVRMPSPVSQHTIEYASIAEEYKTWIHGLQIQKKKHTHLVINLEERTLWSEQARTHALEGMMKHAEYFGALNIVTLPQSSEFFQQVGLYYSIENAEEFKRLAQEHYLDDHGSCFFPKHIKEELKKWIPKALEKVHAHFFKKREALSLDQRRNFMQILNLLIELKVFEVLKPTYVSHVTKDGLDEANLASGAFCAWITIGQKRELTAEEKKHFVSTLLGPTLLSRERAVDKEKWISFIQLIRTLEGAGDYQKALSSLYDFPIEAMSFHKP